MPKKRHRRLATGQFLIVHDIMAHLVQVLGIFLFAMEMDSPSSQSNRKGKYIKGEIEFKKKRRAFVKLFKPVETPLEFRASIHSDSFIFLTQYLITLKIRGNGMHQSV